MATEKAGTISKTRCLEEHAEVLPRTFYLPPASEVAPQLLGHWLIRRTPDGLLGGPIVEVEAYLRDDPACHAFKGCTPRNQTMWGPPGRAYVYLIYGYHFCVNAVCCCEGVAEAVLIRAIEPAFGHDSLARNRQASGPRELTSGPAKLCQALAIDRSLDGADLCDPESPLYIARNPDVDRFRQQRAPRLSGKRIGISKAADLPLRYFLSGSPFLSRHGAAAKAP